jgi:DNA-binding beta-propeller fold protein YncE
MYIADYSNNRIRYVSSATPSPSESPSPSSSVTPGPQNNFNLPLQPGVVAFTSTAAGTGTAAYRARDDGFPAVWAQLSGPHGLAWDSANQRLFVSQAGDHRIRAIDRDGRISTHAFAGTAGSVDSSNPLAATVNVPRGLAYEPSTGALFVCEHTGHRIRVVYANGTVATAAGTGTGGFNVDGDARSSQIQNPQDIARDPLTGDFIFSDYRWACSSPAGALRSAHTLPRTCHHPLV